MTEYHNEIKTIRAKSEKTNAILFEEGYDDKKPDWRHISNEVKKYFENINKGDKVEVNFNDEGDIIFLRQIKEDFSDIKESSSLPKANGNGKRDEYQEGSKFGMCCHLAQNHLINYTLKQKDIINLDKLDLDKPDNYWNLFNTLIKRYYNETEKARKELKEQNESIK